MNLIKTVFVTASLMMASAQVYAVADVENAIDVSRVSVSYEQPFYLLKGAAKNTSDKALKNVKMSFYVYQNGRVVDTITTVMKSVEPGETVRWQTPTTKSFNKYMVSQVLAD